MVRITDAYNMPQGGSCFFKKRGLKKMASGAQSKANGLATVGTDKINTHTHTIKHNYSNNNNNK